MKLAIDFNIKFVPDQVNIWAMHAGRGRIFFQRFLEGNCIFLDLSRTTITKAMITSSSALRQQTNMALAWNAYFRDAASNPSSSSLSPPSNDYTKYSAVSGDKHVAAQFGNVVALFKEMKPRDIVLVPGVGGTYSNFIVGELTEGPWDNQSGFDAYGPEYVVQARPVSWIKKDLPRRRISRALSEQMSPRRAIFQLDRARFGAEVFDLAYSSYVSDLNSKSEIRGPNYKADPLDLVYPVELIAFLIAVYNAVEVGSSDQLRSKAMNEIVTTFYRSDLVDNVAVNFQSPGWFKAFSKDKSLVLFVAAGIAVLSAAVSTVATHDVVATTNGQKITPTPEVARAMSAMDGLLNAVSPKALDEAKKKAESARSKIGLNSDVTVRLVP